MDIRRLEELKNTLGKCVKIIVSIRRVAKEVNLDHSELADFEREIRQAWADVQKEIEG